MKHDKLVRDKIVGMIEAGGKECKYHVADDREYESRLKDKLFEEVREFFDDPSEEEMADISEVLDAIMGHYGIDPYEMETARQAKRFGRGGFEGRVVLEEVIG